MKTNIYNFDLYRYYGNKKISLITKIFLPYSLKYIKVWRKANNAYQKNFILLKKYYLFRLRKYEKNFQFQISPSTKIGYGLYIGHTGRIIINPETIIGNNCNIGTGVTIGQENRGIRKGSPIIGDKVWIGNNTTIVGKITVGNNVLIAPNSFVNFNVPDNSIVIGNPGKIVYNENATSNYINNIVVDSSDKNE